MVVVPLLATCLEAAVFGVAVGVAAASGPWWRSDGGDVVDVDGGSSGGPEPMFRRFSYDTFSSMVLVFGIVLFLYQFSTQDSMREVFCGPHDLAMADDIA